MLPDPEAARPARAGWALCGSRLRVAHLETSGGVSAEQEGRPRSQRRRRSAPRADSSAEGRPRARRCAACKAVFPSPLCTGREVHFIGKARSIHPALLSAWTPRGNAVGFPFPSAQARRIVQVGHLKESERSTQENLHLKDVGKWDSSVSARFFRRSRPRHDCVPALPMTLTRAHPDLAPTAGGRVPLASREG